MEKVLHGQQRLHFIECGASPLPQQFLVALGILEISGNIDDGHRPIDVWQKRICGLAGNLPFTPALSGLLGSQAFYLAGWDTFIQEVVKLSGYPG
jgi:hypothetical protein